MKIRREPTKFKLHSIVYDIGDRRAHPVHAQEARDIVLNGCDREGFFNYKGISGRVTVVEYVEDVETTGSTLRYLHLNFQEFLKIRKRERIIESTVYKGVRR